ncbi:flagellar basal-body MS-ring/collar protein FliF [Caldimonas brevitalea]|uniref:Flagellar M-ring protein n=1 Tax=Caldimonas brevitalea TaxID=413882 RepID=A0A0G3BV25_9BURK|nr:flagellar basal-body MS-ring/collar protein FliF [Caldimonas brevitalea]AKJ30370.1 flagellar MS-ring protein [Caldimonas brevitalea]
MLNAFVKNGLQRVAPAGVRIVLPAGLLNRLLPLVVLAVAVTAVVMMLLWRDQATYKPVFGAREKVAASDMMSVLDAEQVPYRLHPDSGQVLVPESELGRVRMLLASKGVVAQLPAGLELMDRSDPLGVSQFVQDVRFRRGIEGELAVSIKSLDAVDSARVHVSIAKSSSFVVSDGSQSSASVVVSLKPGRSLTAEQIAAIIKLVSGSVASLDPQRVSLVDQAGNLLSARVDLTEGFDASANADDATRRAQDEVRRNVRELLAPVLGEDNYKLSVTAVVDNDRVEETHERYGETPKVTNEAMREQLDRNPIPLGVPGSLSNRPVAAAEAASASVDGAPAHKNNATTRQYAYDRSVTRIKRSRGRLAKLGVAVMLNNAAAPSGKGSWTPAEIASIEKMLSTGLAIDAQRGDQLAVTSVAFPAQPKVPVQAWWEQRDNFVDLGSWLLTPLAALFGYLLVLRPLLKMLQRAVVPVQAREIPTPPMAQLPGGGREKGDIHGAGALAAPAGAAIAMPMGTPALQADAAAEGSGGMPVVPLLENYDLPPAGSPVDVMVDHLKVLAGKEPERVAEVVKQWMQKHGRAE